MRIALMIGLASALSGCAATRPAQSAPAPSAPGGPKPEQRGRGQLFISPMGEPFRASNRPGAAQDLWFAEADTDGDGRITLAEFQRDATRFFTVLDRGGDGEIDPDDIAFYETTLVPEIRVMPTGRGPTLGGRRGGGGGPGGGGPGGGGPGGEGPGGRSSGQGMRIGDGDGGSKKNAPSVRERLGAARFGFFDLPEPVVAADLNLNRGIDPAEFARAASIRFAALDRNHDGALTRHELPRAGAETWRNGSDSLVVPPIDRTDH